METIEELKEKNRKLKLELKIKEERDKLISENKRLMRQERYGGVIKVASQTGRGMKTIGEDIGRGISMWMKEAKKKSKKGGKR